MKHHPTSTTCRIMAFFTIVFALSAHVTWAQAKLEGTNPAQWRVTWKTDPATTATVSWNTDEPGKVHRIHLREGGRPEEGAVEEGGDAVRIIDCQRSGKFTKRPGSIDLYYHHARLSQLKPATRYFVTMESDGKKSPEMYFITAPSDDRPFSILFGGDSRTDWKSRRRVNAMIRRIADESLSGDRPPVIALAHGGDYVGTGRSMTQWSSWMTDYEITTGEGGRLLPIIPARGNHDLGASFDEVFDFPPKDKNYYAIDLGSQVRFVTLDTETAVGGAQRAWLEKELSTARPNKRWLVVQYHRPAFPAIKTPGPALAFWVPLFEKYHIDLACEADGHCIKRTSPIRNNAVDPTGVVYVGEGGLGVAPRPPKTDRWYLRDQKENCGVGHHVQVLSFAEDKLTYRVVLVDGGVFDEHVFLPRKPK